MRIVRRPNDWHAPVTALAVSLLAGAYAAPGHAAILEDDQERVDRLFARWEGADRPGCAVGVLRDGEFVLRRAYGMADLEHGVPISAASVFDIASMAKQFTALAVLLLEDRGALSLDDGVREHVPELPDHAGPITLRHLMHHASGLRDYSQLALSYGDAMAALSGRATLELLARQRGLTSAPGTGFQYSNTNYWLLGLVVERASGQSLGAFCEDEIFRPLEMHNTSFREDPSTLVPGRAAGHRYDGGRAGYRLAAEGGTNVGDGGLLTSLEDLGRWEQNFRTAAVGGERVMRRMIAPSGFADGWGGEYAGGLSVGNRDGRAFVEHAGGSDGFRSHMLRYPEAGLAVYVLANTEEVPTARLARDVAALFLGEDTDADSGEPVARSNDTPTSFAAYAGFYRHEGGIVCELTDGDGGPGAVVTGFGGTSTYALEWLDDDRLRLVGSRRPATLSFEPERGLPPERVWLQRDGQPAVGPLSRYEPPRFSHEQIEGWLGRYLFGEQDIVVAGGPGALVARVNGEPVALTPLTETLLRAENERWIVELELGAGSRQLRIVGARERPMVFVEPRPVPEEEARAYLGRFHSVELDLTYAIVREDGALVARLERPGGRRIFRSPLSPANGAVGRTTGPAAFSMGFGTVTFRRDVSDAVVGFAYDLQRGVVIDFERVP